MMRFMAWLRRLLSSRPPAPAPTPAPPAPVSSEALFAPIDGLMLVDKTNGRLETYGPTSAAANWRADQWSSPEILPDFVDNQTSNASASVRFYPGGGFELSQDGHKMTAQKTYPSGNTLPWEFDLFVSPPGLKDNGLALNAARAVTVSGTVLAQGLGIFDNACPMNVGVVIIGIDLWDAVTKSSFFYQIKMGEFGAGGDSTNPRNKPDWFARGGVNSQSSAKTSTFGFDDNIWSSYGMTPLAAGVLTPFKLQVLPALQAAVPGARPMGMDQKLADTKIVGMYFGQSIWGHTGLRSAWRQIAVTYEPA